MKLSLIQSGLVWMDVQAGREKLLGMINSIAGEVDLILLPEMFTTGFTMEPETVAETMQGETVLWLKKVAAEKRSAICGSAIIKNDGRYYNRLLFIKPSGDVDFYDKRHLFSLAGEDKIYTAGKKRLVVEYENWKICPLICYDLRFPVFSRNTENYDLLLYIANWPEPRIAAWDALLKARAIENMCYVAGVNRVGLDGNGHNYTGRSQVIDCLGENIITPSETEGVFVCEFEKETLMQTRRKYAFLDDRDSFTVD